jgi:hypothetical protein
LAQGQYAEIDLAPSFLGKNKVPSQARTLHTSPRILSFNNKNKIYQELGLDSPGSFVLRLGSSSRTQRVNLVDEDGTWGVKSGLKI